MKGMISFMSIFQGTLPLTGTTGKAGSYYITEINQNKNLKLWAGTCSEYELLDTIEDDVIYITLDGNPENNINDDYMLKSIYDKENLRIDIYEYINSRMDGQLAPYDVIINSYTDSDWNEVVTLSKGSYEFVEQKLLNQEPVLALCNSTTTISSYSIRSTTTTHTTSKICAGVFFGDDNMGEPCIRFLVDPSLQFAWYPNGIINRYWDGGENG